MVMGAEQTKRLTIRERLGINLEKPKSTGNLMRIAKGILQNNAKVVEQTAVSAFLNLTWISFTHNDNRYLIRSTGTDGREALFITKYLPDGEAESIQIATEGLNTEQKFDGKKFVDEEIGGPLFHGVSYTKGKETVEDKFTDEETGEISWVTAFTPPIVGKDALPEAQRLLRELLAKEVRKPGARVEKFRRRDKFIQEFIASENKPKSPDVEERINAGYEKLLGDIRRSSKDAALLRPLPSSLDSKTLRKQFIEYVQKDDPHHPSSTSKKLALIYFYGLQDGIEKDPDQIAQTLEFKTPSNLVRSGRSWLYGWLIRHPEVA